VYGIGGIPYVLKELRIKEAAQFSPNLTVGEIGLSADRFGEPKSSKSSNQLEAAPLTNQPKFN
jgi:hypothetical protein